MTIMKNLFPFAVAGKFGNSFYNTRKPPVSLSATRKFTHLRLLQQIGHAIAFIVTMIKNVTSHLMALCKRKSIPEMDLPIDTDQLEISPILYGIDSAQYDGWAGTEIPIRAINASETGTVYVSIVNGDGVLVEDGIADLDEEAECWIYTTQNHNDALGGTTIVASCFAAKGDMSAYGTAIL